MFIAVCNFRISFFLQILIKKSKLDQKISYIECDIPISFSYRNLKKLILLSHNLFYVLYKYFNLFSMLNFN